MAEEFTHIPRLTPFRGLDLTSSKLRIPPGFISGGQNFDINDRGDLVKRPGSKNLINGNNNNSSGMLGLWTGVGLSQEERSELIYVIGNGTPRRVVPGEITVVSTLGPELRFEMKYVESSNTFRVIITQVFDGTELLNTDITSVAISSLLTTITAVTGLTATANADVVTTDNAAQALEACDVTFQAGDDGIIKTFHAEDIPRSQPAFSLTSADNVYSHTLVNDVIYIATGAGPLGKYDGNRFYRAGLKKPNTPSVVSSGNGSVPNGTYRYKIQFVHTDNAGNVVESQLSDFVELDKTSGSGVDISVDYLTTDFSLGGADGPGGATYTTYDAGDTISLTGLTAGHVSSLAVGERVCWSTEPWGAIVGNRRTYDPSVTIAVTNRLQFGTITDKPSATEIDIEADEAGGIADEMPISQNLRVLIWRTKSEAIDPTLSTYYLIGEFPAEGGQVGLGVYYDASGDGSASGFDRFEILGDVPPDFGAEPPHGKFLANYRNQLIVAGVENEPDIVHFSEPGRPDVFATAVNQFRVGTGKMGDDVSGLGAAEDYLMCFKNRSIYRVTGDLGGAFQVDRISSGVGCVSHHSIAEIGEGLTGFLSHKGPHIIARGQQILPMGATPEGHSRLEKFFKDQVLSQGNGNGSANGYVLRKAVAANWAFESKYVLTLRSYENRQPADLVFVYDYDRDFWSQWDLQASIGMSAINGTGLSGFSEFHSDVQTYFFFFDENMAKIRMMMPYGRRDEDYQDHRTSYTFNPQTHWETVGAFNRLKKFLRASVFSMDNLTFDLTVKQRINWDDSTDTSEITYDFNAGEDPSVKGKFREQRARSQSLIFENSTKSQQCVISGYELEAVLPMGVKFKE